MVKNISCEHPKFLYNKAKHPGAIFIQLTTACNARCVNCPHVFTYGSQGCHTKGVMKNDVWDKIIRDIQTMEYRNQVGLYLHHEPLICKSLFEKINQINEKTEAFVVLSTNGLLLNEKIRKSLIEARPRIVHININSAEKEQYEKMTGLDFDTVIRNAKSLIAEADGKIRIEINCPVMPGVDVKKLIQLFPEVQVNAEYWANSRGGLLEETSSKDHGSRFKITEFCLQPEQNFNILFDGSVILCCIDWAHESKEDFPNIMDKSIQELYQGALMKQIMEEFRKGDYNRYKMCHHCALEMNFIKESNEKGELAFIGKSKKRYKDKNEKRISILLATNHLFTYTGSEITLLTIAKKLKERGHNISVYAKYVDPDFMDVFKEVAPVFNDVRKLIRRRFDAAYIQHNPVALEIRHHFPDLPILFASLGVLPFLEQPPFVDLNIYKYLAISEEASNNLIHKGVDLLSIEIFRNIVDSAQFKPLRDINPKPRTAVVYSYKISPEKFNVAQQACEALNIRCRRIGEKPGAIDQNHVVEELNKADIVFTLGRGVIETMMCGKIPIVYDYQGGDGMVTPANIHELMTHNFSGRLYGRQFQIKDMIEEIKGYKPENAADLRALAVDLFDADKGVDRLVSLLEASSKDPVACVTPERKEKIRSLVELINITKDYSLESKRRALFSCRDKKMEIRGKENRCSDDSMKAERQGGVQPSAPINSITGIRPRVTVIIPSFNKFEFMKQCFEALIENTPDELYEAIIINNPSNKVMQDFPPLIKSNAIVINDKSDLGFAGACNQGIAQAKGDYIILLDNSAVVTGHWLERLIAHLEKRPDAGIIGPMGNFTSGPQAVEEMAIAGEDMADIQRFARDFDGRNPGKTKEAMRLEGYCFLIKREVLDIIGMLDNKFNRESFWIDDLCLRASVAGFKNIIAQDVFIYNNDMAFNGNASESEAAMQENRRYFAEKWRGIVEFKQGSYQINLTKDCQRNKLIEWGEERMSQGDVKGAAKIFERVYLLVKDDYKALNNLGVIQWQLGEAVSAINSFQAALSINPKYPDAISNLMNAAKESGKVDMIKSTLQGILNRVQMTN